MVISELKYLLFLNEEVGVNKVAVDVENIVMKNLLNWRLNDSFCLKRVSSGHVMFSLFS